MVERRSLVALLVLASLLVVAAALTAWHWQSSHDTLQSSVADGLHSSGSGPGPSGAEGSVASATAGEEGRGAIIPSQPADSVTDPSGDTPRPILSDTSAGRLSSDVDPSQVVLALQASHPTPIPVTAPGIPTPSAEIVLLRTEPPTRDLVDLAVRMGRVEGVPRRTSDNPKRDYDAGASEEFWVHDIQNEKYFTVTATLAFVTDQAYFWVQADHPFDRAAMAGAAESFSAEVVPAVREYAGSEWSPGVDGDPRLHILHHEYIPGIAGYFSSADEFTVSVEPHSNEHEMFYVNLSLYSPGSFDYLALLAHEFQHMIHWYRDRDEPVWSNEGLSELAAQVAGYQTQTGRQFLADPDTALLEWEPEPGANSPHYAGSYLYFAYLRSHYGDEFIRAYVDAPENGPSGVEAALTAVGDPRSFDEVFADWVVANLVDDPFHGDGRYGYGDAAIEPVRADAFPVGGTSASVHQYATDYYDVTAAVKQGELRLEFEGDPTVGLLAPNTDSASEVWWSNRGDGADSRLTFELDLTDAWEAELTMKLWHDLEENWDYAYYLLSDDGGETWQRQQTNRTSSYNPNGNNYGAGLTGASYGWVDETIDLTPMTGGTVLARLEVVTDDAVSLAGMAVRDLRLRRAAHSTGDWVESRVEPEALQPEGWVFIDQVLPQRWLLQATTQNLDDLAVDRFTVAPDGTAQVHLEEVPVDARVYLAVSAITPATRNVAGYRLAVSD